MLPSNEAFTIAIEDGLLSELEDDFFFAGNFMYMGTNKENKILFKHIDTRQYLHTLRPY